MTQQEAKELHDRLLSDYKKYIIGSFEFEIIKVGNKRVITDFYNKDLPAFFGFFKLDEKEDFIQKELEYDSSFILDNCKGTGIYQCEILFERIQDNHSFVSCIEPINIK